MGDANRHWTRPVDIVATTLVTGVSSALISFHVPENVDKMIDIVGEMSDATNEFNLKVEKLKDGKNENAVNQAYATDTEFRDATNLLMKDFAHRQNEIKMRVMRIKGTAARLNQVTPPPPPAGKPGQ
jgi:hypothetical protein